MRPPQCIRWTRTLLLFLSLQCCAFSQEAHYSRFRDAKWYARQIETIQDEIAKVDTDLRALVQARKSGKGVTDAVALDQEPEGVTSEGQIDVSRKRRFELLRQIDTLEEQARHNAIPPGDIRKDYQWEEPATVIGTPTGELKAAEVALVQAKEDLDRFRKEAELLHRDQRLKAQQENSNPEPRSRRDKPSDLVEIGMRLTQKEAEAHEAEQRVTELEDQLEDLRQLPSNESEPKAHSADSRAPADASMPESSWGRLLVQSRRLGEQLDFRRVSLSRGRSLFR